MVAMALVIRVFLIFLLVALLAGGIAMLGNQLGRKIGRKKMTVFGMRPRHTSIFITTITGSLIAVLTLAVAMVASQDVRDTVLGSRERIEKYQARERQLQIRVQELAEDVRRGTIIWNYEERVALNTIPSGADEETVARIIGVLLNQANYLSVQKNNRISVRHGEKPFEVDTVLLKYSPDEVRQWVEKFTGLAEPVGLWVVVTENCLWQDPVPVTVEAFAVDLVYEKGETVFKTDLLPSEFLLDWHVFLEDLKAAALRRGMIEMNDSLGGEVTADTLKRISATVSNYQGKVQVSAVANRDLYQSSNLDVSFEVKPVVE